MQKTSKILSIVLLVLSSLTFLAVLGFFIEAIAMGTGSDGEGAGWYLFIVALAMPAAMLPVLIQEVCSILTLVFNNSKRYIGAIICGIATGTTSFALAMAALSYVFVLADSSDSEFVFVPVLIMSYFVICLALAITIVVMSFKNRKK